MAGRKAAAPPAALSQPEIENLLGEIAILQGQLNWRTNKIKKHVQFYGPVQGRGFFGDNRQSWYEAPRWAKLARCVLLAKPDQVWLQKLLELCFEKIGAKSFWGFSAIWKQALPELHSDTFQLLDECDEDGGKRRYYGKPSIGVRKSTTDPLKNLPIELGAEPLKTEPDALDAIFIDGTNLTPDPDEDEDDDEDGTE